MESTLEVTTAEAGGGCIHTDLLPWAEARGIDPKQYDFYCAPVFGELGLWRPDRTWAWYPDEWPLSYLVALPLLLDVLQNRLYRTPDQIRESTGIHTLRAIRNLRKNLNRIYAVLGDSKDRGHFIQVRKGGGFAVRGNPERSFLLIGCDSLGALQKSPIA